MGALHANGAMLVRSRPGKTYRTPATAPFTSIEAFRERIFSHPLVYVPAPLAYFAVTRSTTRSRDQGEWAASLAVLVASYVRRSNAPAASWRTRPATTPKG